MKATTMDVRIVMGLALLGGTVALAGCVVTPDTHTVTTEQTTTTTPRPTVSTTTTTTQQVQRP